MKISIKDHNAVKGYKSRSQIARILSENWFTKYMYCPSCGFSPLARTKANTPMVDFSCVKCTENFQSKSKGSKFGRKIIDSAYSAMMDALEKKLVPNFFFMHYDPEDWQIINLIAVPGYFLHRGLIEQRNPLSQNARRSGYIGCNILYRQIPSEGKLTIIKDGSILSKDMVIRKWRNFEFVKSKSVEEKGWLFDILECVNKIDKEIFALNEIYNFEDILAFKHPENHNIRPKIRQQLQILRDKGLLDFVGRGVYRKKWRDD